MSRTALRTLVRAAFALATTGLIGVGCSRQAEGERCDLEWAGKTQDCDSGLVCTACGALVGQQADRCCPADGTYSDARCQPASVPNGTTCSTHKVTGTGGSGGTGGTDATGGTSGAPETGGTSTGGTSTGGTSAGGTGGTSEPTAGATDQPVAGAGG
jgi:hypothetical protein